MLSGAAAGVAAEAAAAEGARAGEKSESESEPGLVGLGGLPSRSEMAAAAASFEAGLAAAAVPRRHAHQMGEQQFAYNDMLSSRCGTPPLPEWRADMYRATGVRKRSQPRLYRDGPLPWGDEGLRDVARAEAAAGGFAVVPAADEAEEEIAKVAAAAAALEK